MKILSLFPKSLYDTKMSPGRTAYLNHTGRSHDLTWSGCGWPNYDAAKSVQENIESIESGGTQFDAVVVYKGDQLIGIEDVKRTRIVIFNEAHDTDSVPREISEAGADVVVFHHHGDYLKWKDELSDQGKRVETWCHASPRVTYTPWRSRIYNPILSGCLSERIYPLRFAASEAITSGLMKSPHIIGHPGYRVKDREQIKNQYFEYLRKLSLSKVSICCSSIYKYPLAKLFESAMCGCVLATDLPACPEFERLLWPLCIQLKSDMSPLDIAHEINSVSDSELRDRSEETKRVTLKNFSYDHWSACLISAIQNR
tara:strand:+ start:1483 stop:2421 length:939 start_codon:yes stop_codon:yes gene_type:complete